VQQRKPVRVALKRARLGLRDEFVRGRGECRRARQEKQRAEVTPTGKKKTC
jgi:hypothetical protein